MSVAGALCYQLEVLDKAERMIWGVSKGVTLEDVHVGRWREEEVIELVKEFQEETLKPYRDAKIDPQTGEVIPEELGREVLVKETVEKVMEAEKYENISLEFITLYPKLTSNLLQSFDVTLGEYTTWMSGDGNKGRINNIELASAEVNYTLLFPGQIFSFNQATQPRTWERGYRFAPIIVGDSVVEGIGGGVCQVSSTIYNAALEAELKIVERHPHGEPVDYVPPGRDAAVANDYLDLKFQNNTERLLLITGWAGYGQVHMKILSSTVPLAFHKH